MRFSLVVALLVGVVLAGCGGDDGPEADEGTVPGTTVQTESVVTTTTSSLAPTTTTSRVIPFPWTFQGPEQWDYDYRSDVNQVAFSFETELTMTFFEDGTLEWQRRNPAGHDGVRIYCVNDSGGPPGRLVLYQTTDEFLSKVAPGTFSDSKWEVNLSDTEVLEGTYTQDLITGGSTEENTRVACSDDAVDGGQMTVRFVSSFEIPRTSG